MKLYIANEIIKSLTFDRPAYNTSNEHIGSFVYTGYYLSKKLVLIIKDKDGIFIYQNGAFIKLNDSPYSIINPKKLDISHDIVDTDEKSLIDTVIGITNLRPLRKITKKKDIEKISKLIDEYNAVIDDKKIYITGKNYKTAKEYLETVTKKAKKGIKIRRKEIKKEVRNKTKEEFCSFIENYHSSK